MKPSLFLLAALTAHAPIAAQEIWVAPGQSRFDVVAEDVQIELENSLQALKDLRVALEAEKVPMTKELNERESQLVAVRAEYNDAKRKLDNANLDVSNLTGDIKRFETEVNYLDVLLSDYVADFGAGLQIAELQRYEELLDSARLAPDDAGLTKGDVFRVHADVLLASLDRIDAALGGQKFEGEAIGDDGLVSPGTFVVVGPFAVFLAAGQAEASTIEQPIDSLEAVEVVYANPEHAAAAGRLVERGDGMLPFDPTLGNAHKMAAVEETFLEHVKKGGPVMWPIGVLAGTALLVALVKWFLLMLKPVPSQRRVEALLDLVARREDEKAALAAAEIKGPMGKMLQSGVRHVNEPRELVEESMYEKVLTTRLNLQSYLPFIAICAASAPLLGLLGTVTGIINTFKMIELFGSGDVKSLSGGISEALITTKFGLVVAIPSLLLHAFLSRKARGFVDRMEKTALAFVNRLNARADHSSYVMPSSGLAAGATGATGAPDPELVRRQVSQILGEMLGPIADDVPVSATPPPSPDGAAPQAG